MIKHNRYHSIGQFKDVLKQIQHNTSYIGKDENGNIIRDYNTPLPTLIFTGSEKLHGTNAAVGFTKSGKQWEQSRERVLSLDKDNAGFCAWARESNVVKDIEQSVKGYLKNTDWDSVIVYGEWCGANIQPQVALSKLPKQFIVFGIKVIYTDKEFFFNDKEYWLEDKIVSELVELTIFDFATYEVTIDFNDPTEAINKMVEITNNIEAHSPIGLAHGIDGIGEGVVWKHDEYIFKVKGRLHSASHVKELIPIDVEKVKSIKECVNKIVSENRLKQGLEYLKENNILADNKAISSFINWVKDDCIKEELDIITESNLEIKDVIKEISIKAKDFFIYEVLRK